MCYLFQKIEVNMTRISLNFLVVLLFSIVFSALLVESTDEEAAVLIESNLVLAKSASSKKDLTILKKRDSLLDSITKNVKNLDEPNINDSESEERKYSDEKKMNKKGGSVNAVTSFGLLHAFFASFSVIIVSEIGDKTFFIAAIMAMKHSRSTVSLSTNNSFNLDFLFH